MTKDKSTAAPLDTRSLSSSNDATNGILIFQKYYHQPLQRILKPFFFASVSFSIPITRMFLGNIVWRGMIYTILMFIGKLMCGLWLVKWTLPSCTMKIWPLNLFKKSPRTKSVQVSLNAMAASDRDGVPTSDQTHASSPTKIHPVPRSAFSSSRPAQPASIYPSLILGCAMVARGEISFLIPSLAQANGIFGDQQSSPLSLIVTRAIVLCTLLGPIMVGLMTKRLNRLSKDSDEMKKGKILGVWGAG